MRYILPSGYLAFPKSVHLWASITNPDETRSMALFERVAASLVQEVQDKRLLAYLSIGTKVVEADFPIDGEAFRSVLNGDPVDLAPPHVASPTRGVVVFNEADVIRAAALAHIFPSVRVPVHEAVIWIATLDPEAVAAFRARPAERKDGDNASEQEGQHQLVRAIEAGRIAAFGRLIAGKNLEEVQPIATQLWRPPNGLRLHFGSFSSSYEDGFYAAPAPLAPLVYYDLEISRIELLKEFPVAVDYPRSGPIKPDIPTLSHPENHLHELIRNIADELNPKAGPPTMPAKLFRSKISDEVRIERGLAASDTTIKEALKGTRHMRPPKQRRR